VRIGVVGLGTIGRVHLEALGASGITHTFGADPSPIARVGAEATFGTVAFADLREMLQTTDLDGVVVATPPRTHRDIVIAALELGVGVLCEKPMALTIEDCEAIGLAAERSGRPLLVGFCHRFQPEIHALRELAQTGALGTPVLFNATFMHGLGEGREWLRDRRESGGGVLIDSGSHAIDLFRYLAGEIDAVLGFTSVIDGSGANDVEDATTLALRAGPTLGAIQLSWKSPPWEGRVELVGTAARAIVAYDGDDVTLRFREPSSDWVVVPTHKQSRFGLQMEHFLACLRGEATPTATARDGLEATKAWLHVYGQDS
jgi:predicted dehydrogenase